MEGRFKSPPPPPPSDRIRARKSGAKLPLRIVINGVEGVGKTTIAAYAPTPVLLMARDETGIDTLTSHGRAPAVDCIECANWLDTLATLDDLASAAYETVALDALGGFERLCHEHVCATSFGGDWSERGFLSFQRGYETSVGVWLSLLQRLDRLRASGKTVLILSHACVRTHRNPLGADYDRYVADCHAKTWGVTHRWADVILFYTFITEVSRKKDGRTKLAENSGTVRAIFCERTDAYDAKNRIGLDPMIVVPDSPAKGAEAIWSLLRESK